MLATRVVLKNLENLTYNIPKDDTELASQFHQEIDRVFNSFYGKLPQEAGVLIRPVTQEKVRKISMKYKRQRQSASNWTCSSLPRYHSRGRKAKKVKHDISQVC